MYMTNEDRNIRTLIACFVIALVALVPLRIVEQQNFNSNNVMVLGEEVYNTEEVYEDDMYVVEEEIVDERMFLEDEVIEEEIDEGQMVLGEETEVIEEEIFEEEIVLPETQ